MERVRTWQIFRWSLLALFFPKKADEETRAAVQRGHIW